MVSSFFEEEKLSWGHLTRLYMDGGSLPHVWQVKRHICFMIFTLTGATVQEEFCHEHV